MQTKKLSRSVGIFHMSPIFTKHCGEDDNSKLKEFEDVLKSGYVNTVLLADRSDACFERSVELCKKYNCTIWFSPQKFFSKNESIEEYTAHVEKSVEKIKKADAYDLFLGFYWDEPFLNQITNDDFLLMTKTLYEKWGKRNFPVFSFTQFVDKEPLRTDNRVTEKIKPDALEYVTDISWDNYSYDVGSGALSNKAQNDHLKELADKWGGSFKTSIELFEFIHNSIMSKVKHPVNVWFYPGAYCTSLWTGSNADERVCIDLLNFFDEFLNKQQYRGGLIFYTYINSKSLPHEKGLSSFLKISDDLLPDEQKWETYSKLLKELKERYQNTKEDLIVKL